jgi:hypothetical protein
MVFALRLEKTKVREEEKKKENSGTNSSFYTRAIPSRARQMIRGPGERT